MEFLGTNQKELSIRLDITPKHLSNILSSKSPITYESAIKLATVVVPSAKLWMNFETNFQLNKSRLEKLERM
ncbi:MAG: helix-turn-helix transcriptional regulator [Alkaliphilus sp.]